MASIYEVYVHGAPAPDNLHALAVPYGVVPGPKGAEGPCLPTIVIAETFRTAVRAMVPAVATVCIISHPAPPPQP